MIWCQANPQLCSGPRIEPVHPAARNDVDSSPVVLGDAPSLVAGETFSGCVGFNPDPVGGWSIHAQHASAAAREPLPSGQDRVPARLERRTP